MTLSAPPSAAPRVRFAPSPTGYLHIGGVRTALFNWLFARHHGGKFILRVDDTDTQRNLADALAPILDGFRWLGIDWDEGAEIGGPHAPYYQSERLPLYQAAVDKLLAAGFAYRDYARPEETQAERAEAEAAKRPYVASRRWAAESDADRARFEAEGRTSAVRLKMPREGVCRIDDLVRGTVESEWSAEADHVIQRADGTCLYHLASVVDDVEMAITHVIRAEEHLPNTPRQIFIFEGLGAPPPAVRPPSGRRRAGEPRQAVEAQARQVPEEPRVRRALPARPPDRRPARPRGLAGDLQSGDHRLLPHRRLPPRGDPQLSAAPRLVARRQDGGALAGRADRALLARAGQQGGGELRSEEARSRSRSATCRRCRSRSAWRSCCPTSSRPAGFRRPLPRPTARRCAASSRRPPTASRSRATSSTTTSSSSPTRRWSTTRRRSTSGSGRRPGAPELLAELARRDRGPAAATPPSTPPRSSKLLTDFVAARGLGLGAIVHAVRVAVAGKPVGFGLFDILALLGRERVLARLARTLRVLEATPNPPEAS